MLTSILEALIFGAARGVSYDTIKSHFGKEYTEKEIKTAINQIKSEYSNDKGIVLIEFNGKYQFRTNEKYGEAIADVILPIKEKELSSTVLKTLSIIAYRQPITRAEIEEVRNGSSSDYALGVLVKLELIEVVGRKETLGRPALFATTDEFLKRFKLKSLSDLPNYNELLKVAKNSDKYYKNTDGIYREENEVVASDTAEYFEDISDDVPDFLKDEEIITIENN